ncbi:jg12939 [Pararge aegeria aegeria]|uniref:Jg12939 protein n=1 Tax=Pararge aegeria aegeria TaxID=348720 RepID=A0A8S4SMF4_9NEOP|nr:jg12939 [Pararge aegeria aegeria]
MPPKIGRACLQEAYSLFEGTQIIGIEDDAFQAFAVQIRKEEAKRKATRFPNAPFTITLMNFVRTRLLESSFISHKMEQRLLNCKMMFKKKLKKCNCTQQLNDDERVNELLAGFFLVESVFRTAGRATTNK